MHWEDVLAELTEITVDKDELAQNLSSHSDAVAFCNLRERNQALICRDCGVQGWEEKLRTTIEELVRCK